MSADAANPAIGLPGERRGPLLRTLRGLPWFGILLLLPVLVWGILGPAVYPHDPTAMNLLAPHKPPAWLAGGQLAFPLGTDQFGRDVLSQLMAGARPALIVSFCGVALAAGIGIPAGLAAGYFGGWIDHLVMRLVDVKMSIPSILLTLLIGGAIGGGLPTILASIALVFWADYARVLRSQALTLRDADYVALARVANCSNLRILATHVFPNVLPTVIVLMTLQLGRALIVEASITFIGLGIQPPGSAWGLMVAEGRGFVSTDWWIPTFPGLCITMTVLGANIAGDWLRDRLDPRLQHLA
jgi:peptide/nickel transport system permease protein